MSQSGVAGIAALLHSGTAPNEKSRDDLDCRLMFPGYVFLVTDRVRERLFALRSTVGQSRIPEDGSSFIPLYPSEKEYFPAKWEKNHLTELSEGDIEGDCVAITTCLMGVIWQDGRG